jgi:hypothetical protein
MQCDVRAMHPDDVPAMWAMVQPNLIKADYRYDREDRYWSVYLRCGGWRFDATAHGYVFDDDGMKWNTADVFVDFYPPNGGNVRFDAHVHATNDIPGPWKVDPSWKLPDGTAVYPKLIMELGQAIRNYGHGGKNRLAAFMPVENPPQVSWWGLLRRFITRNRR